MKIIKFNNINYIIGTNSRENWKILEDADEDDIWIHLHQYSSPYVILQTYKKIENADLLYGGFICKQHSKYKNVNNVNMIFSLVKYVKKGKFSGEAVMLKSPDILRIPTFNKD